MPARTDKDGLFLLGHLLLKVKCCDGNQDVAVGTHVHLHEQNGRDVLTAGDGGIVLVEVPVEGTLGRSKSFLSSLLRMHKENNVDIDFHVLAKCSLELELAAPTPLPGSAPRCAPAPQQSTDSTRFVVRADLYLRHNTLVGHYPWQAKPWVGDIFSKLLPASTRTLDSLISAALRGDGAAPQEFLCFRCPLCTACVPASPCRRRALVSDRGGENPAPGEAPGPQLPRNEPRGGMMRQASGESPALAAVEPEARTGERECAPAEANAALAATERCIACGSPVGGLGWQRRDERALSDAAAALGSAPAPGDAAPGDRRPDETADRPSARPASTSAAGSPLPALSALDSEALATNGRDKRCDATTPVAANGVASLTAPSPAPRDHTEGQQASPPPQDAAGGMRSSSRDRQRAADALDVAQQVSSEACTFHGTGAAAAAAGAAPSAPPPAAGVAPWYEPRAIAASMLTEVPDAAAEPFKLLECFRQLPNWLVEAERLPQYPRRRVEGWSLVDALNVDAIRVLARQLPCVAQLACTCRFMRAIADEVAPGLDLSLHTHQRAALKWMLARERPPRLEPHPCQRAFVLQPQQQPLVLHCEAGRFMRDTFVVPQAPEIRGGILGDEPGLGKTVTVLALIIKTRGLRAECPPGVEARSDEAGPFYEDATPTRSSKQGDDWRRSSRIKDSGSSYASQKVYLSSATLVVVPPTLLSHWQNQVTRHASRAQLRVLVLPERRRSKSPLSAAALAAGYDIVLTTFDRLSSEWRMDNRSTSLLLGVHWLRVILDEGHMLGATLSETNRLQMAVLLRAERRWMMTGTPTPDTEGAMVAHLFPLLTFLRCPYYADARNVWDDAVQAPFVRGQPLGRARLMGVLERCMIRASKASLPALSLPPCHSYIVRLPFTPNHQSDYNDLVDTIKRNMLLADWFDDEHKESILFVDNSKWCVELVENVRMACCIAGSRELQAKEEDVLETLQMLARSEGLEVPEGPFPPYVAETHPLRRVEDALREGAPCELCAAPCRMLLVTPCCHLLCADCVSKDVAACPLPSCRRAYEMQQVDDSDRKKFNRNPKWEVPRYLIELQPVFHQKGATGKGGGRWQPHWQNTESSKVKYLVRRLREVGAVVEAPEDPPAAAAEVDDRPYLYASRNGAPGVGAQATDAATVEADAKLADEAGADAPLLPSVAAAPAAGGARKRRVGFVDADDAGRERPQPRPGAVKRPRVAFACGSPPHSSDASAGAHNASAWPVGEQPPPQEGDGGARHGREPSASGLNKSNANGACGAPSVDTTAQRATARASAVADVGCPCGRSESQQCECANESGSAAAERPSAAAAPAPPDAAAVAFDSYAALLGIGGLSAPMPVRAESVDILSLVRALPCPGAGPGDSENGSGASPIETCDSLSHWIERAPSGAGVRRLSDGSDALQSSPSLGEWFAQRGAGARTVFAPLRSGHESPPMLGRDGAAADACASPGPSLLRIHALAAGSPACSRVGTPVAADRRPGGAPSFDAAPDAAGDGVSFDEPLEGVQYAFPLKPSSADAPVAVGHAHVNGLLRRDLRVRTSVLQRGATPGGAAAARDGGEASRSFSALRPGAGAPQAPVDAAFRAVSERFPADFGARASAPGNSVHGRWGSDAAGLPGEPPAGRGLCGSFAGWREYTRVGRGAAAAAADVTTGRKRRRSSSAADLQALGLAPHAAPAVPPFNAPLAATASTSVSVSAPTQAAATGASEASGHGGPPAPGPASSAAAAPSMRPRSVGRFRGSLSGCAVAQPGAPVVRSTSFQPFPAADKHTAAAGDQPGSTAGAATPRNDPAATGRVDAAGARSPPPATSPQRRNGADPHPQRCDAPPPPASPQRPTTPRETPPTLDVDESPSDRGSTDDVFPSPGSSSCKSEPRDAGEGAAPPAAALIRSILKPTSSSSWSPPAVRAKAIVFSQFNPHLDLLNAQLSAAGVTFKVLRGHMTKPDKAEALATFEHNPACGVLLMDATGAVGLDLSFVEWVFLMEPLEDRSLESQIVSRAHRLGAKRAVRVETLVMQGTAEDDLVALQSQESQRRLAAAAVAPRGNDGGGQDPRSRSMRACWEQLLHSKKRSMRNLALLSLRHVDHADVKMTVETSRAL